MEGYDFDNLFSPLAPFTPRADRKLPKGASCSREGVGGGGGGGINSEILRSGNADFQQYQIKKHS